jgi:hypothetical protein
MGFEIPEFVDLLVVLTGLAISIVLLLIFLFNLKKEIFNIALPPSKKPKTTI